MYKVLLFFITALGAVDFSSELGFLDCPVEKQEVQCPESILASSILHQAELLSKTYALELAKLTPPSSQVQPEKAILKASIWFDIDLDRLDSPSFESLAFEPLWEMLREIGVQGVHLKGLKKGGAFRTGLGLDPKWGEDWDGFAGLMEKKGIALITNSIGKATGLSTDFLLALKNFKNYPSLYHLIEIEPKHWKLLPKICPSQFAVNIPWLSIQELHKRGYVPEDYEPYVKTSQWNATAKVNCIDGKVRRWIYLKENAFDPVIDWLNPSFAGYRIAAADVLESIYNLGASMIAFDDSFTPSTSQTLALWTRKLGSFSLLNTSKGLNEYLNAPTDLIFDHLTRPALMHALITQDAEALRLMYRLFLGEKVQAKRLVHSLQPFSAFSCDWSELLESPHKKFPYYEEMVTGEALRVRLMKEDVMSLNGKDPITWPQLCMVTATPDDFQKQFDKAQEMHLLLALFYAMQPGVFSFSVQDLLGTITDEPVDLICPNDNSLYGSLPSQMRNRCSFASRLRNLLIVRSASGIAEGDLVAVPSTTNPGLLILIHQLDAQKMQLLAVNFSNGTATETLDLPYIRQTSAIDLMTGIAEKKPLSSPTISLSIPPLSGKVILFQPKYYD